MRLNDSSRSDGHAPSCMPSTKAARLKLLWLSHSFSSAGSFAWPSRRSPSSAPLKSFMPRFSTLSLGAAPSCSARTNAVSPSLPISLSLAKI